MSLPTTPPDYSCRERLLENGVRVTEVNLRLASNRSIPLFVVHQALSVHIASIV